MPVLPNKTGQLNRRLLSRDFQDGLLLGGVSELGYLDIYLNLKITEHINFRTLGQQCVDVEDKARQIMYYTIKPLSISWQRLSSRKLVTDCEDR